MLKIHGFLGIIVKNYKIKTIFTIMVTNEIWTKYGVGKDELCMGCLEKRMCRKLKKSDIDDCPVSSEWNPYTRNILRQ